MADTTESEAREDGPWIQSTDSTGTDSTGTASRQRRLDRDRLKPGLRRRAPQRAPGSANPETASVRRSDAAYPQRADVVQKSEYRSPPSPRLMEVSRLRHKLMVYRALAALFFIGFVAVFAYARMAESGAKVQIGYFETKQADRQAELEAMRAEVDRLRAQVDALTKGPMPGLDKITFGMPIELDEGYVQYVELDTVDTGGSPAFGYRLLLRNGTTSLIQPQVTLHLFSDVGHPVGYAAVGPDEGYLAPNEKRTVEGRFRLEREGEPVYFRVDVN